MVDGKDEFEQKKVANLLTTSNNSNSNRNSKPKISKLISFSLFIKQVILNHLGDWNDTDDER